MAALAIVVCGAFLAVVPSSPASAALPPCTSWSKVYVFWGVYAKVPTTLLHSGNMNCALRRNDEYVGVDFLEWFSLRMCHGFASPDSRYDQRTEDFIRFAQASRGITADGIYGPQTRNHAIKFVLYDHWTNSALLNPDRTLRCDYVRG
jgi:hypothetical protein